VAAAGAIHDMFVATPGANIGGYAGCRTAKP
jgi:hypothetical protein